MRLSAIGFLCGIAAISSSAYAVNPPSEDASGLVLHSMLSEFTGRNSDTTEPVAEVKPGETVTITGDCITRVPSADSLRVVLTLAMTAEGTPGYRAVLATDQHIESGSLQVRVPDVPEAENQVFQVKVFRLGEATPQTCDAGSIRIGAQASGKVG